MPAMAPEGRIASPHNVAEAIRVQTAIGDWLASDHTNVGRVQVWLTDVVMGTGTAWSRYRMTKIIPGVWRDYSNERGRMPYAPSFNWFPTAQEMRMRMG